MECVSVKRYQHFLLCLVIAVCTLIAFWPLRNAGFINYDDNLYVFENRFLAQGFTWETVKWAFSDYHTGYWHPLTWLTIMSDYQFFGEHAGGYHWTNVLFHLINGLLLYGICFKMTDSPGKSAAVAMLFALHPLHVESVAWISERKDVLSAFFFLLTIGAYIHYVKMKSWGAYLSILIVYLLGLMSKPSLVVLPCILLLLDYWPLQRIFIQQGDRAGDPAARKRWLFLIDKIPLFILSGIVSIMTVWMAGQMGGNVSLAKLPFFPRIQNTLLSYGLYLKKMIWPFDLAVFYPFPSSFSWGQVILSTILLVVVTGLALRWIRSRPYFFFGWFWYLGILFPVSGLFQNGEQAMADRYTYLSLIGIFLAIVWGAAELGQRWHVRRAYIVTAAIIVTLTCLILTRVQVGYWQNGADLFEHALRVTTNNYVAHNSLGLSLAEQGRTGDAVEQYRRALILRPNFAKAHNNMALSFMEQGRHREAIDHLHKALVIDPGYASAYNNLGIVLSKTGDTDGAIRNFVHTLDLNPLDAEAHNNLGIALSRKRKYRAAAKHFIASLQLMPNDATIHHNLGLCLLEAGYPSKAKEAFHTALKLKPDFAEARKNLASVMALESPDINKSR